MKHPAILPHEFYIKLSEEAKHKEEDLPTLIKEGEVEIIEVHHAKEEGYEYVRYLSEMTVNDEVEEAREDADWMVRDEAYEEGYEDCLEKIKEGEEHNLNVAVLNADTLEESMKADILSELKENLSEKELEEIKQKYIKKG